MGLLARDDPHASLVAGQPARARAGATRRQTKSLIIAAEIFGESKAL
jgi:hypothetical protein